jgi:abortive infection alpha-like protein
MEGQGNGYVRGHAEERASTPRVALEAAPGLARLAAGAWLRTAEWTAGSALRAGRRMAGVAIGRESAADLARDAQTEILGVAQRVLGVSELERRLSGVLPMSTHDGESPDEALRRRGHELLERSSDLAEQGDTHPAYARILGDLAPDEARILRLLATEGPQPAIDVRTWRPLDVGSSVVAPGLTMIGEHAGIRHQDRLPAYLSNLFRLGLIWFSRERLDDPAPYQVLEAQPDVIEAIRDAGRARIVRRSINLTPFGRHFCSQVLPVETAEIDALGEPSAYAHPGIE